METVSAAGASPEFVAAIPIAFARRHKLLGLRIANGRMPVVIGDIAGVEQVQIVARLLDQPTTPVLAPSDAILAAINEAYQQPVGQAQAFIEKLDRDQIIGEVQKLV